MGKTPDPRIKKLERLLSQAMALLGDIRATPPKPARRRRRRQKAYRRAPILAALREGARPTARASERDPRLPSYPTFQRLRRRDRAFDEQVRKVLQERPVTPKARRSSVCPPRSALHERHDLEAIAKTIEAGVRVGARNKERCGLPGVAVIRAARDQYPWFDARVGPIIDRRRKARTPIDQAATLAGIRRGAIVSAYPPEAGMPPKRMIYRERREDPAFDAAVRAAMLEARRARVKDRIRIRIRALPGAGVDWDAVAREIEAGAFVSRRSNRRGSLPPAGLIELRLRTDPVFAARVRPILALRHPVRSVWGPAQYEDILERARTGTRLWRDPPEPGMPSGKVLERMRRQSRDFAEALSGAVAEARRRKANMSKLCKMGRDAAWKLAQAAVPKSLEPDARDDIVGELSLQLVAGIVAPDGDLSTAWKRCRTRLTSQRWKEVSLDAPLDGYQGASRIDFLTDDTPHF